MAHDDHHEIIAMMLLLFITFHFATFSEALTDAEILANFKKSLYGNTAALSSWNETLNPKPCIGSTSKWKGLHCNNNSNIVKLRLENMGLTGVIDIDTLAQLKSLRSLSLMNNSFEGPIPEVNKLTSLRNLYLSRNSFSGEIPEDAFAGMNSLKELYLAQNQFGGEIPGSLVGLKNLRKLNVEGNQFHGKIPDFQHEFLEFNVAWNRLEGSIPPSLANISPSSFEGNEELCGKPLQACESSKRKVIVIVCVAAGIVTVLTAILACAYVRGYVFKKSKLKAVERKAQKKKFPVQGKALEKAQPANPYYANANANAKRSGEGETGKLHFVRNDREKFELHDLLRASAEALGSGTFGSSYKAVLLNGPALVVKRFRRMNTVGKAEFYEHMRRLGTLSHPNLLPLLAFYYRKDEKLLISDFARNGSLASHLHANRSTRGQGLGWPPRLKIVKGVAKALAYLYKELPNLTLPHGHLRSSNVLLNQRFEPLLTDYALAPMVNQDDAEQVMVAFKSPEFTQTGLTTRKTDVWTLGVLILEILTGKFPENYLQQGKGNGADLATWVNSVVREEWTGEVFDMDMTGTRNGEGEMLKLLKIGMCCCERNLERRWDLRDAVEKIEELKEKDMSTDDDYSSYASEGGELYSSRAMTDDDFSFSVTA